MHDSPELCLEGSGSGSDKTSGEGVSGIRVGDILPKEAVNDACFVMLVFVSEITAEAEMEGGSEHDESGRP